MIRYDKFLIVYWYGRLVIATLVFRPTTFILNYYHVIATAASQSRRRSSSSSSSSSLDDSITSIHCPTKEDKSAGSRSTARKSSNKNSKTMIGSPYTNMMMEATTQQQRPSTKERMDTGYDNEAGSIIVGYTNAVRITSLPSSTNAEQSLIDEEDDGGNDDEMNDDESCIIVEDATVLANKTVFANTRMNVDDDNTSRSTQPLKSIASPKRSTYKEEEEKEEEEEEEEPFTTARTYAAAAAAAAAADDDDDNAAYIIPTPQFLRVSKEKDITTAATNIILREGILDIDDAAANDDDDDDLSTHVMFDEDDGRGYSSSSPVDRPILLKSATSLTSLRSSLISAGKRRKKINSTNHTKHNGFQQIQSLSKRLSSSSSSSNTQRNSITSNNVTNKEYWLRQHCHHLDHVDNEEDDTGTLMLHPVVGEEGTEDKDENTMEMVFYETY